MFNVGKPLPPRLPVRFYIFYAGSPLPPHLLPLHTVTTTNISQHVAPLSAVIDHDKTVNYSFWSSRLTHYSALFLVAHYI